MYYGKKITALLVIGSVCFFRTLSVEADVNAEVKTAIVRVVTEHGEGTGVVFGHNQVLTAWHVVMNPSSEEVLMNELPIVRVEVSGVRQLATVARAPKSGASDLVLLQVDTGAIKPLPFADSLPKIGDMLTWFYENGSCATSGVLRAVQRHEMTRSKVKMGVGFTLSFNQEMLILGEADTKTVKKGSSGSPILNDRGEIVGVMTLEYGWGPSLGEILKFLNTNH